VTNTAIMAFSFRAMVAPIVTRGRAHLKRFLGPG